MLREREEPAGARSERHVQTANARRRLRKMRPRTLALAAAGGIAAVVAFAAVGLLFGSDTTAAGAAAPTATASVARRDLVQRSTVSGTLGYGDLREILNYR